MALTRFPIETTNPKIEVTLPVGRHVLELVVEDSAGLRSAPDQIVIEVRKEVAVPTITGINPVSGIRGNTVDAVINGTNLSGATAVDFSGSGITAKIRTGGTAGQLPVSLIIAADAATGARSFTVKTPAGTAASPTGVAFSVAVEPKIIPVEPRVLPIDIKPIDIKPIEPQPVIAEPQPLTIKPIVAEPQPLAVSPIIAEPKLVIAEPKLAIVDVIDKPATPGGLNFSPGLSGTDTMLRTAMPSKAAPKSKAAAKKSPTTRKKK
jgi:hypothetical protein